VDPIQPIRGQPPAIQPIPPLTRTDRTEEKRRRDEEEQRRRKRRDGQGAPQDEPPDDGRPHVDIRV
jgi:hypothetical protein